jgi:hypothetical protein
LSGWHRVRSSIFRKKIEENSAMPALLQEPKPPLAVTKKRVALRLKMTRPSILDPRLAQEPWIETCPCSDAMVLYLHNRPIAVMAGSSLDQMALDRTLYRLRHRYPRSLPG